VAFVFCPVDHSPADCGLWTVDCGLKTLDRYMPGYLALVLHAHLPFVRHPEHERFLEETWLFEAITEAYLPLLQLLDRWRRTAWMRA